MVMRSHAVMRKILARQIGHAFRRCLQTLMQARQKTCAQGESLTGATSPSRQTAHSPPLHAYPAPPASTPICCRDFGRISACSRAVRSCHRVCCPCFPTLEAILLRSRLGKFDRSALRCARRPTSSSGNGSSSLAGAGNLSPMPTVACRCCAGGPIGQSEIWFRGVPLRRFLVIASGTLATISAKLLGGGLPPHPGRWKGRVPIGSSAQRYLPRVTPCVRLVCLPARAKLGAF